MDVYEEVTNRILTALENGVAPWAKPWEGGDTFSAISHATGKAYSFMNQLLLGKPGEYLTFNQVKEAGGKVKKGAKSKMVVFWKWIEKKEDPTDPEKVTSSIPFLRYFNVFHIDDVEGVKPKWGDKGKRFETSPIEAGEKVFTDYTTREGITVSIGDSAQAYYRPSTDTIRLPGLDQFKEASEYYSTAFHEATHSTGHEKRLNRLSKQAAFGDDYSKEELVAELGSCFICATLGIDTDTSFRNSAAYLNGWLSALANDRKLIVSAAGAAEKAANLILNK